MKKTFLLVTILTILSCSKNDEIEQDTLTKKAIHELILSQGSNYSIKESEAQKESSPMIFKTIDEFKTFLEKKKSNNYEFLKKKLNSLDLKDKSGLNKKINERFGQQLVVIEYPQAAINLQIVSRCTVKSGGSQGPVVWGNQTSYFTGFTLGVSYDHLNIRGYARNSREIELFTRGLIHYNIVVEGIGTVYTEEHLEWSVYNYEQHRLTYEGSGGTLLN